MFASTAAAAPARLRRRGHKAVVQRSLFHPFPFRRQAATPPTTATHEPANQESEK